MLNIWKKAYKKDGRVRAETLRTDGGRPETSRPAQLHPSQDYISSSQSPDDPSDDTSINRLRRTATDAELDSRDTDSSKRLKVEQPPSPALSQKDLSPQHQEDVAHRRPNLDDEVLMDLEAWKDSVFRHIQHTNTLAVAPSCNLQQELCLAAISFSYRSFLPLVEESDGIRPVSTVLVFERLPPNATSLQQKLVSELGFFPILATDWQDLSTDNAVTITTGACLNESLVRRIFRLQRVKLLIFVVPPEGRDRGAIKNVMNGFYSTLRVDEKPRIFAVTLMHPHYILDDNAHILRLLQCSLFQPRAPGDVDPPPCPSHQPMELVVLYEPPFALPSSPILEQLAKVDPRGIILGKQLQDANLILHSLGAEPLDLMWKILFRSLILPETTVEPSAHPEESLKVAANSAILSLLGHFLTDQPRPPPKLNLEPVGVSVTSKFVRLLDVLKNSMLQEPLAFRCIILVQYRIVALALVEALQAAVFHGMLPKQLQPCAVYGHGHILELDNFVQIHRKFDKGDINVMIATRCFEELGLPDAGCVIRFDLLDSSLSYANSRACVKDSRSHLILMAERGNAVHRRILRNFAKIDIKVEKWMGSLKGLTSAPPPRTLEEPTEPYRSDSDDDNDPEDFIQDPTTSGRIYPADALSVVYRLVAHLDVSLDGPPVRPLFRFAEIEDQDGKTLYTCTIMAPSSPSAPPRWFEGSPCLTHALARRAVCYELCYDLFRKGVLDYRLFPRPRRLTPPNQPPQCIHPQQPMEVNNGQLRSSSHTGGQPYPRKSSYFWQNTRDMLTGWLYPITIYLESSNQQQRSHHPLLLMTHLPLPPLRSFSLYRVDGIANVRISSIEPFEVDHEHLEALEQYTTRLLRLTTNRPLVRSSKSLQYYLAPLKSNRPGQPLMLSDQSALPNGSNCIDWDLVSSAVEHWIVPLRGQTAEDLQGAVDDCVLQDRTGEFTRRFEVVRIRPDLNPLSKLDANSSETFLDELRSLRKGSEDIRDLAQPLLEVNRIPGVSSHLSPLVSGSEAELASKFLIPETCFCVTIPASVFRMAHLIPSITRRIDDMLLVKELNAGLFDNRLSEKHLHAALTLPGAGMDFDYERLELLGDAFLKYVSSVYFFVTQPQQSEGVLHLLRQSLISNASLLKNAILSGIPPYAQSRSFLAKFWTPPGMSLASGNESDVRESDTACEEQVLASKGCTSDDLTIYRKDDSLDMSQQTSPQESSGVGIGIAQHQSKKRKRKRHGDSEIQHLNDKSVADVMEAIIGAAYLSGGRETALLVAKRLHIPIIDIDSWDDFGVKILPPFAGNKELLSQSSFETIQGIVGHNFKNPLLLVQALTHKTAFAQSQRTPCYERLEFLGDAILDFLTICHLFSTHSEASPGDLTLLKSAMVANSVLAAICVHSGLYKFVIHNSEVLGISIESYANEIMARREAEHSIAAQQGVPPRQYWLELEPPKALSDVIESIIGALFISDGFQPIGVEAFFDKVLKPFYNTHINANSLAQHPTKILFELLQSHGCQSFEITKEEDEDNKGAVKSEVVCHDIVLASATDLTAAMAARRCSTLALDALEGDPSFMKVCNCRSKTEARRVSKRTK